MIEPLPRAVRDYLAAHRVACVFVTAGAKLGTGTPGELTRLGPVMALWWCANRAVAKQIVVAIGEEHPATVEQAIAEIKAAAARLNVALSDHSVVLARAQAAVSRLDGKLASAQSVGYLKFFNRAYQQYRLACRQRGKGAMPYGAAMAKLRQLLAQAAAGSSIEGMVERVFAGRDVG